MDESQDKLADSGGAKEPIVVDTSSTLARLDEGKQIPILNSDRVDLIETAVRFLKNPKVVPTPLETKRLFLAKKGLTESEINRALKQAGCFDTESDNQTDKKQITSNQLVVDSSAPVPPVKKQLSLWSRLVKWIKRIILAGCLAFTGYKLIIQKYFMVNKSKSTAENGKRLINNNNKENSFDTRVAESLKEMRVALTGLKDTVEMMGEAVKQMNAQRNTAENTTSYDDSAIKSELQSIKSLLLSRSQFPSPPRTQPILPSWQLEKRESKSPSSDNQKQSSSEGEEESTQQNKEVNNNVRVDDDDKEKSS